MNHLTPVVVVSRCLEFEPVRYNGQVIPCPLVKDLEPFVDYIKVCPEYEIGLGVPRDPIRIVQTKDGLRLIQPKTQEDITEQMNAFTKDFLDNLPKVDGFIFKSDSPTIGLRNIKIYGGVEKAPVVKRGQGFFAGQILEQYPDYPMEEENRLRNNTIRHHFLIKLFLFANFRQTVESKEIDNIQTLHTQNHFLYKLYDEELNKQGERILHQKNKTLEEKIDAYFQLLKQHFKREPVSTDYIRVWREMIEYFTSKVSRDEKNYFETILHKYQGNRICETGVMEIVKGFALRFSDGFIEQQRIFDPYPEQLLPIVDTKRDKDYWK